MKPETTATFLRLNGLSKLFGTFRAIDDLSLDIARGEVFALLGPSGCGKSTTLRQIAGLDEPDTGQIVLDGRTLFSSDDGTFVPAQKRNMGMVFQSYAIWPHLDVFETIAYPLRLRRLANADITTAVERAIAQVGLTGLANRPATNLSGGQQQRVALARALVYEPDVLLLDEPFSNLDDKLRKQMRVELKILQRKVGITVIIVTHDQSEALSLSDRIAVMNMGHIEQVGTPHELYENPHTAFVRDFIGQTAHIPVTANLNGATGKLNLQISGVSATLECSPTKTNGLAPSGPALACIRPEEIRIGGSVGSGAHNVVDAVVDAVFFIGDHYECVLDFAGLKLMAIAPRTEHLSEGDIVPVQFPEEALTLWPR